MKKILLLAAALCVVTATVASAQPRANLSLGWSNCRVNGGGTSNLNFVCNNAATPQSRLVAGLTPTAPLNSMTAGDYHLDVYSQSPTLVDWWRFIDTVLGTPGCRPLTQVSVNFDNSAGAVCDRIYWPDVSTASGGISFTSPSFQANHGTIRVIVAVDNVAAQSAEQPAVGAETNLFNATIGHANSTGTGACAGCQTAACLTFMDATVFQSNNDNFTVAPGPPPRPAGAVDQVTWNSAAGDGCASDPTGARNATWGKIKSLYR